MDYTQANTKKREMAKKMAMGLVMNGPGKRGGPGMKYRGTTTGAHGPLAQKPEMHGKKSGYAHGQKPKQADTKGGFSDNYDQNGKDCY